MRVEALSPPEVNDGCSSGAVGGVYPYIASFPPGSQRPEQAMGGVLVRYRCGCRVGV